MALSIGRIGIWTSSRQWPADEAQLTDSASELDELGYGALWLGGSTADLSLPRAVLDATKQLTVATGILDVWLNPVATVAANHRRLLADHPGRFLLGLGASHAKLVEPATGERYVRPLRRLSEYLDQLDAAVPPVPSEERVLGSLGPKALQLAATRAAGAHPYLVTPEHTAEARAVLLGSGPLLAPEQKVVLESDPATARAAGRRSLAIYLDLPNYLRNLRRLGFGDDDFAGGGSDRLVDALVAWGDLETVRRRIDEHLAAGADHVAVQVVSTGGRAALPLAGWRELAEAVTPSA
jgi:probable F420-dependent oxidoreductase